MFPVFLQTWIIGPQREEVVSVDGKEPTSVGRAGEEIINGIFVVIERCRYWLFFPSMFELIFFLLMFESVSGELWWCQRVHVSILLYLG